MFELNIPSEIWSSIIVLTLFAVYPRVMRTKVEQGKFRTRKLLIVLGFFTLIFAIFLAYKFLIGDIEGRNDPDAYLFYGMLIIMTMGSIYLIAEGYLVKGHFDKDKIKIFTPWTGKKEGSWDNLRHIKYGWFSGCLILVFSDGTNIRISTFLLGYKELIEHIKVLGFDVE